MINKAIHENTTVAAVRRSAPWWIWVAAASFVLNFALVIYLDFEGPVLGFDAPFTRAGAIVTQVYSQSPAAVAGIQAADQAIRADGRRFGRRLIFEKQ